MRENVCVCVCVWVSESWRCSCMYVRVERVREISHIYMDLSTQAQHQKIKQPMLWGKFSNWHYTEFLTRTSLPFPPSFLFSPCPYFFIDISRPSSGNRPSLSSTVRDQKLLALYHYDHYQINVFGSVIIWTLY